MIYEYINMKNMLLAQKWEFSNLLTEIESDENSRNLDLSKTRVPLFYGEGGGIIWAPPLNPQNMVENLFSPNSKNGAKTYAFFQFPSNFGQRLRE